MQLHTGVRTAPTRAPGIRVARTACMIMTIARNTVPEAERILVDIKPVGQRAVVSNNI